LSTRDEQPVNGSGPVINSPKVQTNQQEDTTSNHNSKSVTPDAGETEPNELTEVNGVDKASRCTSQEIIADEIQADEDSSPRDPVFP